jgi:excisionase family DNA binding protein
MNDSAEFQTVELIVNFPAITHSVEAFSISLSARTVALRSNCNAEPAPCALSVAEAASLLGISEATLTPWIHEGKIRAIRIGGHVLAPTEAPR